MKAFSDSLIREGGWVALGQFGVGLGTLVGLRILTEVTPKEVFGEGALLLGVVTLFKNIFCAPLLLAGLRMYPDAAGAGRLKEFRLLLSTQIRKIIFIVLPVGAAAGIFLSLGTGILSLWTVAILGGIFFVDTFRSLKVAYFSAERRQAPYAIWGTLESWGKPLFTAMLLLALSRRIEWYLLGTLLVTSAVLAGIGNSAEVPVGPAERTVRSGEPISATHLWAYALPLMPVAVMNWGLNLSDRYLIGGLLGASTAGGYVAVYGLASQPFLILSSLIASTLRPRLFEAESQGDAPRCRRMIRYWLLLVTAGGALGVVAFFLLGRIAADLCLAAPYRPFHSLLGWIAMGYAFFIVAQALEMMLLAKKATSVLSWAQGAAAITNVLLNLILIPRIGVMGAAFSTAGCFLAYLLLCAAYIFRRGEWWRPASA